MAKKKWTEFGISVMLIALAVTLYMRAREFPLGADLFPKTILATVIVLAVLMFIDVQRGTRAPARPTGEKPAVRDQLRPYLLFTSCLGYVALILTVGFFPATVAIGVVFMAILDAKQKRLYMGIFGGTILFIYLLFGWFLAVPLPKGVLFG